MNKVKCSLWLALAAVSATTHAQFVMTASQGLITHGVYAVGANSAVPVYDADGFMLSPGFNYPTAVGAAAVNTTGLVNGFVNLNLNTGPAGQFGGAGSNMRAVTFPGGAGLRWGANNWVRDNPANNGFGSYNVSGGNVRFDAPAGWAGLAGIYLPMMGFAAGVNAYVAASMVMEISIYNNLNGLVEQSLYTARIFHDGAGARQDGVWVTGPLGSAGNVGFVGAGGVNFAGYGVVTKPTLVPVGGYAIVRGRYTLLADPDSGMDFDLSANPGVPLPQFGYEPVPEPASMTALALGALAALRRRKRVS